MKYDLTPVIRVANRENAGTRDDYEQNGRLYCGACHTPKQTAIPIDGKPVLVGCLCKCAERACREAEEARRLEQARQQVKRLRINGIQDRSIRGLTFAADDGRSPVVDKARRYVAAWERMQAENIGLLLWGNTGNGKTFAAACIANALIDAGVSVLMTSFPRVLSALTSMYTENRVEYLDSLSRFGLLVLDDLGVERESAFSMEQVYTVIDGRYKAKKPLVITTNLTLNELKYAPDMDRQRIYDRVLEMCVPVKAEGESRRKGFAAEKLRRAAALLGHGQEDHAHE